MAVRQIEYLFSISDFKEPAKLTKREAIALLLTRLILMDPGTDPLHPDMGVGIRKYRFGIDNLDELRRNTENQIQTYLPDFQNATVEIKVTKERYCNIEISVDNIVYIYDSKTGPIPIKLSDIINN